MWRRARADFTARGTGPLVGRATLAYADLTHGSRPFRRERSNWVLPSRSRAYPAKPKRGKGWKPCRTQRIPSGLRGGVVDSNYQLTVEDAAEIAEYAVVVSVDAAAVAPAHSVAGIPPTA